MSCTNPEFFVPNPASVTETEFAVRSIQQRHLSDVWLPVASRPIERILPLLAANRNYCDFKFLSISRRSGSASLRIDLYVMTTIERVSVRHNEAISNAGRRWWVRPECVIKPSRW